MNVSIIPEELRSYIKEEAEKENYKLVDITVKGGKVVHIEVILDKEGGITLDECGDFNKDILSWIEKKALFSGGYTLDVCSPGLDRELKTDNDFNWAAGRDITVNVKEPVDNKNSISGKLVGADGFSVTIEQGTGHTVILDRKNITRAKLVVKL